MRAVGIETDEVSQRVELSSTDVIVAAVGIDLKVMNMTSVAEKGDGIVAGQLDALTD